MLKSAESNPDQSPMDRWFRDRGWGTFDFQRETWEAIRRGESGLVHAPTGLGKTYALLGGFLAQVADAEVQKDGPELVWVTPMRALASDTTEALRLPMEELGMKRRVGLRHGDTPAAEKRRQRERPPNVLVTTPESLTLLLSYPESVKYFSALRLIVVDEWHELLGTKRGVQTELALARLRRFASKATTWGLSATLGNLKEAADVLLGSENAGGRLITAEVGKVVEVHTLIPATLERFPWSGHIGTGMAPAVARQIEAAQTTLLFTNTRSQTELWHEALLKERPEWRETVEIHHGSLDREHRRAVERRLDAGELRCVVCTSSLDLGVDFSPVDQVIQVGSPKGIARLLQRAGRSGHQPGAVSRIYGVPTNAFELLEFAAAREALKRGRIEARLPLRRTLDVLVQHCVTVAAAGLSTPDALFAEVRETFAFQDLTEEEWSWTLEFVERGGRALSAYPRYAKVVRDSKTGLLQVGDQRIVRQHRMGIGTITSDAEIAVHMQRGGRLGSIEESFVSRLKVGDVFAFGGRRLELVRFRDLRAVVRPAKKTTGPVPRWQGGRSPLSTELAGMLCDLLSAPPESSPEFEAAGAILKIQRERSRLPTFERLLIEFTAVRGEVYVFLYPFAGRMVHEGLAALVGHRLGQVHPGPVRSTVNDYGFSLFLGRGVDPTDYPWRDLFSTASLASNLEACMNSSELMRKQFREISRIAGLIIQGFPGREKSARQLQVSAGLLFDVFQRYDPDNLLLRQATREILDRQLEFTRLREALARVSAEEPEFVQTERLTPFAFPLWADQLTTRVSGESWLDRVAAMAQRLSSELN